VHPLGKVGRLQRSQHQGTPHTVPPDRQKQVVGAARVGGTQDPGIVAAGVGREGADVAPGAAGKHHAAGQRAKLFHAQGLAARVLPAAAQEGEGFIAIVHPELQEQRRLAGGGALDREAAAFPEFVGDAAHLRSPGVSGVAGNPFGDFGVRALDDGQPGHHVHQVIRPAGQVKGHAHAVIPQPGYFRIGARVAGRHADPLPRVHDEEQAPNH
jgi:hypothetical protein